MRRGLAWWGETLSSQSLDARSSSFLPLAAPCSLLASVLCSLLATPQSAVAGRRRVGRFLPSLPSVGIFRSSRRDNLVGKDGFRHAVAMKLFLFAFVILPISVLAEGGLPNQPYIYVEGKAEI